MTSRRWLWPFVILVGMTVALAAQTPKPTFEVVSVRPATRTIRLSELADALDVGSVIDGERCAIRTDEGEPAAHVEGAHRLERLFGLAPASEPSMLATASPAGH